MRIHGWMELWMDVLDIQLNFYNNLDEHHQQQQEEEQHNCQQQQWE